MIPQHLRQKLKVDGQLREWSEFCHLIRDSYHVSPKVLGKMDLDNLLLISHIDKVMGEVFPKMMKYSHEGKMEFSIKLSVPELLSLWQIISITPNPDHLAMDLVAQIDQHAQNLSHLVILKPKAGNKERSVQDDL